MEVYKVWLDYNEELNSPWDALWYYGDGDELGDDEDIEVLDCEMRLAAVWKPLAVRLEKRDKTPDIYGFESRYAVSERTKDMLMPIVGEAAEFLPLSVAGVGPLFVLHSLLRADLDERAVVSPVSGNITVIREYSFDPGKLQDAMPIFQVRQAIGSPSRDAGFPCTGLLVGEEFRKICEEHSIRGVVFKRVF